MIAFPKHRGSTEGSILAGKESIRPAVMVASHARAPGFPWRLRRMLRNSHPHPASSGRKDFCDYV